ncbi:MAG TPA: hypothetical protein VJ732_08635 [Bryobacteraceae bacterium]|nr:hypothetical protein [Bryobacteraceae bacterium]
MSSDGREQPFDSIESAIDFMNVLAETILEVVKDLRQDQESAAGDGEARRVQALDLALFKLKMLNCYVFKSRRALNDLRTIRRLLLKERESAERVLVASAGSY